MQRPTSPSPSSTPVPQIPPHPSHSSSPQPMGQPVGSPLYGSPRRSPAPGAFSSGPAGSSPRARTPSNAASQLPVNALPDQPALQPQLTDAQKADVIRRHLLTADEQHRVALDQALASSSPHRAAGAAFPQLHPGSAGGAGPTAPPEAGDGDEYPTPYHLEGGDVVAGVYKWANQQAAQAAEGGSSSATPGASGIGAALAGGAGRPASVRRSKSLASVRDPPGSRRVSLAGAGPAADSRATFRAGIAHDVGADALAGQAVAVDEPELESGLSTAEMLQPGGFRRDFVFRKMGTTAPAAGDTSEVSSLHSGVGAPGASGAVSPRNASGVSLAPPSARPPTRSFIDFLSLYGHFGGEDLEDIDEEDEEDDEADDLGLEEEEIGSGAVSPGLVVRRKILPSGARGVPQVSDPHGGAGANERTPLVRARSSMRGESRHKKRISASTGREGPTSGDATVTQAVMMLLKSFVGTGVLFLGKAFYNGGILFSTVVLCFIAMISLYSFLLLVEASQVVHGSFGDIGGALYGKGMRWAILSAIVISQIGFVSAYTIFVSQNLQAFFMAVTNCRTYISIPYLIMAQLVIFLPLAMIRNIQKLSGTALVADAFILIGLIYIFSNEIGVLVEHGAADVALFNQKEFPLLIGTAVFAFEGIGLILPVANSMKEPKKFPRVLTGVMVGTMLLFAGGGLLAYLAYGSDVQTVVFINLPQDDKLVSASQFLYSIAILLSTPLQLFPAVRIMENGIFPSWRSGKRSLKVKWEKNAFRTLTVVGTSAIAWAGATDLDKFVSLIGSVACVPLGFVFPPLLHYKACAHTTRQKVADIALLVFGVIAAIFSTSQTIQLFASGDQAAPPTFGSCPPHA
ncbi:hypothetical protein Rhopal_006737-T1 [Rhodotorula paludigena]|uniref:Amino acid transporter transmembrane domain-containing protein n=1 Tax=Rhodotorula paludigena TaxID=86838 RepID=A0AAV5GM46_9BASI|nr:hypothetical protein Rhopal_006737-T1 [Rhodotorula paludigena]